MTRFWASLGNVGTCRADGKGDAQVGNAMRASVPRQRTGAEQLAVAVNPGNAGGAKGLRHSVSSAGQPVGGGARG